MFPKMAHFHWLLNNLNFLYLTLARTSISLKLQNTGLFLLRGIFMYKKTKKTILTSILKANFIPIFFATKSNAENL
jgi:hypothetical protein